MSWFHSANLVALQCSCSSNNIISLLFWSFKFRSCWRNTAKKNQSWKYMFFMEKIDRSTVFQFFRVGRFSFNTTLFYFYNNTQMYLEIILVIVSQRFASTWIVIKYLKYFYTRCLKLVWMVLQLLKTRCCPWRNGFLETVQLHLSWKYFQSDLAIYFIHAMNNILNTRHLELCPNSNKTIVPFSINSSGVTTSYLELSISRTFFPVPWEFNCHFHALFETSKMVVSVICH